MSQCRERTQKLKHKLQLSHKIILGPPFCLFVAIKRTNCLFPHRPTPPPLPTYITYPLPYSMFPPSFASNWCWQMSEFCGLLSIIQINLFGLPWGYALSAAAVHWIVQYLKYTNMSLKLYCYVHIYRISCSRLCSYFLFPFSNYKLLNIFLFEFVPHLVWFAQVNRIVWYLKYTKLSFDWYSNSPNSRVPHSHILRYFLCSFFVYKLLTPFLFEFHFGLPKLISCCGI